MSAFPFQPSIVNPPSDPPSDPPSTPGGQDRITKATGEEPPNVAYKDQVHEAAGDQEPVVPVASALPVSQSRSSNEDKDTLERRILELERQQLIAEQELQAERSFKKKWVAVGSVLALLLLITMTVVGVCASGNCGRGGNSSGASVSSGASGSGGEPSSSLLTVPTNEPIPPSPALPTTPRAESIVSYINSITLSGRTLTYPNSGFSAEEQALKWLIDEDSVGTAESNPLGVRQRYVMATLWYQNGQFDTSWLSSGHECDWSFRIGCVGGEVTRLRLYDSELTGQLPSELGLLTALTDLGLDRNQLTGSIPSELGLLTALRRLELFSNQLTGTIPAELEQLTAIATFLVYNNDLSGNMPFCDGCSRPRRFALLQADCNEVICECCTECCPRGGFNGIPGITSSIRGCIA